MKIERRSIDTVTYHTEREDRLLRGKEFWEGGLSYNAQLREENAQKTKYSLECRDKIIPAFLNKNAHPVTDSKGRKCKMIHFHVRELADLIQDLVIKKYGMDAPDVRVVDVSQALKNWTWTPSGFALYKDAAPKPEPTPKKAAKKNPIQKTTRRKNRW